MVDVIDLLNNRLSYYIPSTIGELQNLVTLYLAHNRLEGPIPETFCSLIAMVILNFSYNNLSGLIPKSLKGLSYLKDLNVSFNRLSRKISNGGPFRNFTNNSFLRNKGLCGDSRLELSLCHFKHSCNLRAKQLVLPLVGELGMGKLS
ncbi:hypothetical protein LguiB_033994 [Lonicera macranthoides]